MLSIAQWLQELGLAQYADAFEANDIDVSLLPRLNNQVTCQAAALCSGRRALKLGKQQLGDAEAVIGSFTAVSPTHCRIYSKYLALQIKSCEVGLLPGVVALTDKAGAVGNSGPVSRSCAQLCRYWPHVRSHRVA